MIKYDLLPSPVSPTLLPFEAALNPRKGEELLQPQEIWFLFILRAQKCLKVNTICIFTDFKYSLLYQGDMQVH